MIGYTTQREVLLHIGWPKTGTTTVQKHGLNKVPGHRYLGKVPFEARKNRVIFNLVHLVAYAGEEQFQATHEQVFRSMMQLELELFGEVDSTVPLIISEEAFLSALLKPSDHQHHGCTTASLSSVVDRLARLERLWNISFQFLISQREMTGLLHAYYAQMYNTFVKFKGLDTFQGYVAAGMAEAPGRDLGFRYLRPGVVLQAFEERFGKDRVHAISMDALFSKGKLHLDRWYHGLPEVALDPSMVENQRSVSKDVKLAHERPIWEKKRAFNLKEFVSAVRALYRTRYADHRALEVLITMDDTEKASLMTYLKGAKDRPNAEDGGAG